MFYLIVSIHFLLCLILVGLVLIQQGKGADMGAAFGAGGSNTLFGAAGAAPTIIKLTTGVCVLFMITSVLLIRSYDDYAKQGRPMDALKGSVFDVETTSQGLAINPGNIEGVEIKSEEIKGLGSDKATVPMEAPVTNQDHSGSNTTEGNK